MSNPTVIFLGTGGSAGTPLIGGADGGGDWGECDPAEPRNRRSRPSIVIQAPDGRRLLVDTGPDLRSQLIACNIPKIDALLYTHSHADHVAGLDEVRILNRLIDRPLPAYASAACWAELKLRFDYAFRAWTGQGFFRPVFATEEIQPGETLEILGMQVRVIGLDHGYTKSLGLRIGNFAYCTDVVRMDEAALSALEGLDIFVVDCFTRHDAHPTHANLEQVRNWVKRLQPKRTILTHLGPSMDYAWMSENLPANIEPAFDGQVINAAG